MFSQNSFNRWLKNLSKIFIAAAIQDEPKHKMHRQRSADDEIANAVLILAADVIRCDRNFNDQTEQQIRIFLKQHFADAAMEYVIKNIQTHLQTGTEPFVKIACRELRLLASPDSLLQIIRFLFRVAAADDFINAKESKAIRRMAQYLHVSTEDFEQIYFEFKEHNNPYHTLGIPEDATWDVVKRAYRKSILRYHPDKIQAPLTEAQARIQLERVQKAFMLIKQTLGKDLPLK